MRSLLPSNARSRRRRGRYDRARCKQPKMQAPEFWHAPRGLAAGLLTPLGAVWNGAGVLRRAVVHSYSAPVPVVCVGNLVAGGSGKTPVVLSLLEFIAGSGAAVHV